MSRQCNTRISQLTPQDSTRSSAHRIFIISPAAVEGIGDHMGRGQSTWRVRAMVDRSRARRRRCGLRISGRVVARAAAVMVPCLLCEGEKGRERKAGQDRASCVTGAEEPIQLAPKTTPYKGRLRRWSTVHPGSRRYRGFLRSHFGPKAPLARFFFCETISNVCSKQILFTTTSI